MKYNGFYLSEHTASIEKDRNNRYAVIAGKEDYDQQFSQQEIGGNGFHEFGILVCQCSHQKQEHQDEMVVEDVLAVAAEFLQMHVLPFFPDAVQVHGCATSFVRLM